MKKFTQGDIIYNSIKTHPRVKFFVNSGSIFYNNDTSTEGNTVLFDFLRTPEAAGEGEETFYILSENSDVLLSENGDNLIIEE